LNNSISDNDTVTSDKKDHFLTQASVDSIPPEIAQLNLSAIEEPKMKRRRKKEPEITEKERVAK